MPSRTSQIAQVGKRQIELSNLTKVLFPEDHIVKAQLIEYYLKIAPTILAHVKGRPLSLVRYPDGIGGESFFQKNRPDWAPDWIEHVTLGEEKKDYVIATEEASLVWLANLACIELHQMHSRAPHFDKPDYIVYDFDPPESFKFPHVAELALEFKEHLESFGYHPFVKTTGRKGLHVLTPIEPKWEFQKAFEAAKAVAQPFVDSHASSLTLQIKKDSEKARCCWIFTATGNHRRSLPPTVCGGFPARRFRPRCIGKNWIRLKVQGHSIFTTFRSASCKTEIRGKRSPLTRRRFTRKEKSARSSSEEDSRSLRATYKTPEQLEIIPGNEVSTKHPSRRRHRNQSEPGSAFVVHRHHASRLHYDLRLEQNGVLKSWAVPKGLPPRPGIMRLAVNVEDHPLEYVHFEGAIPKGEYGGGMMWKFAQGRYEITKEKKDGFYFRLQSRELNAEYRTHHTKENQWLLERVDKSANRLAARSDRTHARAACATNRRTRTIIFTKSNGTAFAP